MLRPNTYLLFGILLLSLVGLSCSDSYIDNVQRGGWYNYEAGLPELRLSTTGYFNEQGVPTIGVSGDVVYGGLIYKQNKDGDIQADISIEIIVRDVEDDMLVADKMFSRSLIAENNSVIHSQNLFRFAEQFEVKPGEYEVSVTVTDDNSGKQMVRKSSDKY
ncbi:MAG: hypothetical protein U5K71_12525 [Gracilimonas sp.]|nr:hypothetical protein [Gracilimonas sp.]